MNNPKYVIWPAMLFLIFAASIAPASGAAENTVLIVDDNDASKLQDGIASATHYRDIIGNISYTNGINYTISYWNQTVNSTLSLAELQSYAAVIWSTGTFFAFAPSASEQPILENYVTQGGNLIISGEFMLEDASGIEPASDFTRKVLHANNSDFIEADLDDINITNISHPVTRNFGLHDIFSTTSSSFDHTPDRVNNAVGSANVLAVRGPASSDKGKPTIIAFENQTNDARVIYFAFSIYLLNSSNRTNLVQNAMKWMDNYPPTVNSVNLTPGDLDSIDPNQQINITANVTDLYNVSAVKFSYKCAAGAGTCSPGTDTFTNLTMFYNATTNLW